MIRRVSSWFGTLSAFSPDSAELKVKPDSDTAVVVKVSADTIRSLGCWLHHVLRVK
jgi:hypothetical protein